MERLIWTNGRNFNPFIAARRSLCNKWRVLCMQDWRSVVIMMGKSGKMAFKRRIQERDPDSLNIEVAIRAYHMINQFTERDLEKINKCLVAIFRWVSSFSNQTAESLISERSFKPISKKMRQPGEEAR